MYYFVRIMVGIIVVALVLVILEEVWDLIKPRKRKL